MTEQFSRPGAVDLSGLSSGAPAGGSAGAAGGAYVIDVTEANFAAEVVEASMQYVVVLALWSSGQPQSRQVADVLAGLAASYEGRFLLARVDVDAMPQIAQAVGAQGVPFVMALLGGRPVAQIPNSTDEQELRTILDQLTQAAVANGITGRAQPRSAPADETETVDEGDDPRFVEADAALAAGDYEGAIAGYQKLLTANPADREAAERLAGVQLMHRTAGADLQQARAAAAERPTDVDAQTLVADLDVAGGHVEDAFDRLIGLVAATREDDRERARTHLIELFEVVGQDDPRVLAARRRLANALF